MTKEIMETTMTGIELVSLIASIASLILAIGAIWLSIAFFKMSNEASKSTTEAAKGIDASIQRLENLFDKLYSDTFTMMKDTVSDMRKHIWSGDDTVDKVTEKKNDILEEADRKAEEKVLEIKKNMDKKLEAILAQQKAADGEVVGMRNEIEKLLDSAIQTSRSVESEAREETVRDHILMEIKRLKRIKRTIQARDLVNSLSDSLGGGRVIKEIKRMKDDELLDFTDKIIAPDTKIWLL
ncbi:hypothetical protein H5158_22280 [Pseudoalteromonas sp. SR45-6]|uniref:hypothetical protein n=1 Tax=Pseudoalteromonas sp. SR45-6 TaxID=2760927 RepID=UPI0015FF825F|nr:hypothetical protein [Pseudoalteromonas sp. SR45-6]MBB1344318.1 hypothetical protein [Pseudoalteromonas sp. SR45-6]